MRKQTEEEDDDDCDGGDGHFNGKHKHCTQKSESFFSWFFFFFLPSSFWLVLLFASTCFSTHSPPFFSTFYWRMIMFWDEKELYLQQQYLLSLEDIILSMSFSSAFALPPPSSYFSAPALSHTLIELTHSPLPSISYSLAIFVHLLITCN